MALHPEFPTSPYAPLIPSQRWFPADETLRSTTYEKLLPPLVAKIREEVFAWRQSGYRGASATSISLLHWWFETEHLIENADGALASFRYYFAQREAVETLIWLYDVRRARDKFDLLRFDASGAVSSGMFDEEWPRYVLKMATGAGKTKVLSLLIAWSFFHKLAEAFRGPGTGRHQTAAPARARKRAPEEGRGGSDPRHRSAERGVPKKMVSARMRREQIAYLVARGRSPRRPCALLSVARSTVGYVSRLAAKDAPVITDMRSFAGQCPRYGYRTIHVFVERAGHSLGKDRMYRLWRQERLQVPKKRPRRRVARGRPRPQLPTAINHVWACDFVFDTCADGRRLKCLTVIDGFTRECLAIDVAGGIRSLPQSGRSGAGDAKSLLGISTFARRVTVASPGRSR